jgi:ATP synthase protein I
MDEKDALRDLSERLAKAQEARRRGAVPDRAAGGGSALAQGWRIGLELVAAVVVGTAIGLGLDRWFGTRFLVVVFFFLGVAAGMLNVWRAVKGMGMAVGYRRNGAPAPKDGSGSTDDED